MNGGEPVAVVEQLRGPDVEPVPPSVGASSALAIVRFLAHHGHDPTHIACLVGVDWSALQEQDARVDIRLYLDLWALAYKLRAEPALGLELGGVVDVAGMGLVGHVLFNSTTLRDGIDHYIRLYRLVNDAIQVSLHITGSSARLSFVHLYPEYYGIGDMERTMLLAVRRCQDFIRRDIRLHAVFFQHPQPPYVKRYAAAFKCPLYFNAPTCDIEFPRAYLDERIPRSNPYVGAATLRNANELLQWRHKRSLAERVQEVILRSLAQPLDIGSVASQLHMSRQTLYRRLKLENLSFQSLLERTRYHRALQMLQWPGLSMSEIAYAVGLSELSAFSRAFKRWSGKTPTEFRDLGGDASPAGWRLGPA